RGTRLGRGPLPARRDLPRQSRASQTPRRSLSSRDLSLTSSNHWACSSEPSQPSKSAQPCRTKPSRVFRSLASTSRLTCLGSRPATRSACRTAPRRRHAACQAVEKHPAEERSLLGRRRLQPAVETARRHSPPPKRRGGGGPTKFVGPPPRVVSRSC